MGATYRVDYELDEDGVWTAEIEPSQGVSCIASGKSLSQARRRLRGALAVYLNDKQAAAEAELVDNVKLPGKLKSTVRKCTQVRERAQEMAEQSLEITESAARALTDAGVSLRDAAEILGVSYQRVHQLTAEK